MKHIVAKEKAPDLYTPGWRFVCKTPANGDEYYNKELNQVAIRYRHVIKLYIDQRPGTVTTARVPYPIDYEKCLYYEV
jgi:hypothetical protein